MLFLLTLISLLVTLYCSVVYLRFAAQICNADFRNPLSQALIQVTNPLLIPLRRLVPGWKGKDMAAIVLFALIIVVEVILVAIALGSSFHPALLVLGVLNRGLFIILNTYFFGLILVAIASWIAPNPYSPVNLFFGPILAPLLNPLKRYIKPIGGAIDLTPIILIFVIYFSKLALFEMSFFISRNLVGETVVMGDLNFLKYMMGSVGLF